VILFLWLFLYPDVHMTLKISLYNKSYTEDLFTVFKKSVHHIACHDYTAEQCLAWAPDTIDLEIWHHQRSQQPTYIAFDNDKIAGFIDLNQSGYIHMFYIHPDYQKRGIASFLFEHIQNIAKSKNIPALTVHASITALPVFQKWGFDMITKQTISRNGQHFINYHLEKKLS